MTTNNKVSLLLNKQIPDYVEEYYPLFVVFVTKYFEWLEQQGNPQEVLQTIQYNRDVDTVVSSQLNHFLQTYLPNLPHISSADSTLLIKYFRDFYERKGSENSFKFFFKAFFNDDIVVKRPRESLFKTSDSVWVAQKSLRVTPVTGNITRLASAIITGSSTGATAAVNEVVQVNLNNTYDLLIQRDTIAGTFSSSEQIVAYVWDFETDTSSRVVVANTLPMQTAAGKNLDSHSQLSSDQILQDSFYHQNFSYVVQSRINLEEWQEAVLQQLHPTGHAFFNERIVDTTPLTVTSTFVRTTRVATNIKLFDQDDFYIAPGYSFDRIADFRTGTSATTTAGAITYDATYAYQGENVTWALQKGGDNTIFGDRVITGTTSYLTSWTISVPATSSVDTTLTTSRTQIGRVYALYLYDTDNLSDYLEVVDLNTTSVVATGISYADANTSTNNLVLTTSWAYVIGIEELSTLEETAAFNGDLTTSVVTFYGYNRTELVGEGPTFDKVGAGIAVGSQIITDGLGIDTSVVTQVYHSTTSLSLSAGTIVTGASIFDATSCLLIITWMKDPSGNAAGEENNKLTLSVSSTAGMAISYDDELQRNYRYYAQGDSLFYRNMTFYNSSNTLVNISGHDSGESIPGGTAAVFNFTPFNVNRSQSFSRMILRIDSVGLGNTTEFSLRVSSGTAVFAAEPEDHLNVIVVGNTP